MPPAPPVRLRPRLQRYAWGDEVFIPRVLGLTDHRGPCAEAWFGAHPVAPAQVVETGQPLDAFLAEHGPRYWGHGRDELSYLMKLLAAQRPLSIQAHPNRQQAAAGFAREEAAGIARDAPHRSFRDRNHKPEVIVALTEFDALAGFRAGPERARALERAPELGALLEGHDITTPAGLEAGLRAWFGLGDDVVTPALEALVARLEGEARTRPFDPGMPEYWVVEAHRTLFEDAPPDRGLLFVFLLNLVHLRPGQALYTPAGVPHAYLKGAGVEVMATSDNVLRAGLTPKHIDPATLLEILSFEGGPPPVVEAAHGTAPGEEVYRTPAPEFEVRCLTLEAGDETHRSVRGPETWLLLGDAASPQGATPGLEVELDGTTMTLGRGEACLMPHGVEVRMRATGPVQLFVAGLPG